MEHDVAEEFIQVRGQIDGLEAKLKKSPNAASMPEYKEMLDLLGKMRILMDKMKSTYGY